jgi:hypothetical protein
MRLVLPRAIKSRTRKGRIVVGMEQSVNTRWNVRKTENLCFMLTRAVPAQDHRHRRLILITMK